MNLFYVPHADGETFRLTSEESRHITKVLRMTKGGFIHVTDGKGLLAEVIITEADPDALQVRVRSRETLKRPSPSLHMAIAPTKNTDRFEWFLEKATELGVSRITPLICEHSERRSVKTERLLRVIQAAMKQSLGVWLPEISEARSFTEFIQNENTGQKLICSSSSTESCKMSVRKSVDTLILVGPEGDFSASELVMAQKAGFNAVNLGASRLRTETAGMVAVACFHFVNA